MVVEKWYSPPTITRKVVQVPKNQKINGMKRDSLNKPWFASLAPTNLAEYVTVKHQRYFGHEATPSQGI